MNAGLFRSTLETQVGTLQLAVDGEGILVAILLPNRRPVTSSSQPTSSAAAQGMRAVVQQLNEYFLRKRRMFDLPLHAGGSPFEQHVWTKLLEVPYGVTTSYGAIALELGLANGARAVGRANGANPIPIVIPCHRVIGSDGSLTGYGGGLPRKKWLLAHENRLPLFTV